MAGDTLPIDLSSQDPEELARTLYDDRMNEEAEIPPDPIAFTDHDRCSMAWEKMRRYLWRQLFMLREQNDKPQNELDTATLRGRILEIKNLLDLARKVEQVGANTPDPGY